MHRYINELAFCLNECNCQIGKIARMSVLCTRIIGKWLLRLEFTKQT